MEKGGSTMEKGGSTMEKGGYTMEKEITITLDGKNIQELTENDIIDCLKMLISFSETLSILREGDSTNGNA